MEDNGYTHQGFEDEPLAFDDPFTAAMEELAATQEGLQAERDERDADLSFTLAWHDEDDENGVSALSVAAVIGAEVVSYWKHITALFEHGVSSDVLSAPVTLNMLDGGLAMGALQLLGTLNPVLRPSVAEALAKLNNSVPTPTDEEQEAIATAAAQMREERFGPLRAEVVFLDDEGEPLPDQVDASSN